MESYCEVKRMKLFGGFIEITFKSKNNYHSHKKLIINISDIKYFEMKEPIREFMKSEEFKANADKRYFSNESWKKFLDNF